MDLQDIDLLDRDVFTNGIPHEWFTYLRAQRARATSHPEPNDGPGFWVVTKHADVYAVGRDAETYSSDQERGGVIGLEEPGHGGRLRRGQAHADDGPAGAHPAPQAREQGLHAHG